MSNFICPTCRKINIDCGNEGYKTPLEIKYEEVFLKIKELSETVLRDYDGKIAPCMRDSFEMIIEKLGEVIEC